MPTARYPVLICRDLAGGCSAIAIDDATVGFGPTPGDARTDLREFLRGRNHVPIKFYRYHVRQAERCDAGTLR